MWRRLSILLPLLLVALAVILRYVDPPPVERLRLATFDEYQRLKPRAWEDAEIRILDIDDASLERLGQWPWPRTQLAALVDRLTEAGAAVIAFDVVFAEPDRTSPSRMAPTWAELSGDTAIVELARRLPDHDVHFAAAMAKSRVVLGFQLTGERSPRRPATKWGVAVGGDDPRPFLDSFPGAVTSIPRLEEAAAGLGSINSAPDRDGVNRKVPLFVRLTGGDAVSNEVYPSLAAEALRVAQGASTYLVKTAGGSGQASFGDSTGLVETRIGRASVPTDAAGRLWLYDTGPVPVRVIPAWEVFASRFDADRVDGKIVFIGTSAAGLKDIRATPLNPVAAGVELHAQAAEQALLGAHLERPDWLTGAEMTVLVIFGLALVVLLPRWGAAWCAAVALSGMAVTFSLSWLAFSQFGWLVDPVYPSVTTLLLYLSQSFVLFRRTEAERSRVRNAFGRYISPALVERLAQDPTSLRLGGETREMTILFSDIRGFTSISEKLDAENLTRFLNRFLTPMTDIILGRRGTIDKYMGDAIMAFWNAPIDDPDHAVNAARAALEMVQRLETLNREWAETARRENRPQPAVAIGVGLNTGRCSVGNMGSEQRFDYSVLGDAVNLASRLEGQTKYYGVPIVIGEATRRELDGFACLEIDLIQVKGKAIAASIFTLMGDETVATAPWFHLTAVAQRQMLEAYRARDWARAADALERVRYAADGRLDQLCNVYAERIRDHAASPPLPDWDGVYRATEK
jgi:adenylate cyclase